MNPWYFTAECKRLLDGTDAGRYMFIWEATLDDGSQIRQFEDHVFDIVLNNPDVPVPKDVRISTDIIPRDKVVMFSLRPTAFSRMLCPWLSGTDYALSEDIDPSKENLLAYWLVDRHVVGGPPGIPEICRQVVGREDRLSGKKLIRVLSPSGRCIATNDDNQSYDGE